MGARILQLRIELKDVNPPVWRRVLVEDGISFHKLHKIIQAAVGWFECHLYEFRVGKSYITVITDDMDEDADIEDSRELTLRRLSFKEGARFTYMYDFGDEWLHEVHVEKILEPAEGAVYPYCIDGSGNCPPEDVGGPWGYEDFLDAIRDPAHPQHKDCMEKVGGSFDPDGFKLTDANERLGKIE